MKYLLCMCLIILCLSACEKETKPASENQITTSESGATDSLFSQTAISFSQPIIADGLFFEIAELQLNIQKYPDSLLLRKALCEKAFFTNNAAIVAVGVGRKLHPETGKPLAKGFVRKAANADATRWSAYLNLWLANEYQPKFGEVVKILNTQSMNLGMVEKGDSLFVMMAYEFHHKSASN